MSWKDLKVDVEELQQVTAVVDVAAVQDNMEEIIVFFSQLHFDMSFIVDIKWSLNI